MSINKELILSKLEEDGDCFLWTGSLDSKGIPRMSVRVDGKSTTLQIRRFMWKHKTGKPAPDHLKVTVTCGNPRCLEHMELIPPGEVVSRTAKRANVKTKRRLSGLRSRERAKIDMEKARDIRNSDEPLRVVAERHGISLTNASRVRRNLSWKEDGNPFAGLGA
jgi:hypothetical protein